MKLALRFVRLLFGPQQPPFLDLVEHIHEIPSLVLQAIFPGLLSGDKLGILHPEHLGQTAHVISLVLGRQDGLEGWLHQLLQERDVSIQSLYFVAQ